jgi:hypothetical protein
MKKSKVCKSGVKRSRKKKSKDSDTSNYDDDDFSLYNKINNNLGKFLDKNKITKILWTKVKPEIEKLVDIHFIPKTDEYTTIFPNYNDYNHTNYMFIVVRFKPNGVINTDVKINILYEINRDVINQVYNIFAKYLPNNYEWDGNTNYDMQISFKKNKKTSQ